MEKIRSTGAPMPCSDSQNPNPNPNSELLPISKSREEGELSSSDHDDDENDTENPVSTATASANAVNLTAAAVNPPNKLAQGNRGGSGGAGKVLCGTNPGSSVDIHSRPQGQSNNEKIFEKYSRLLKTANSGLYPPSGSNSNLVISFSDGDSGSDSEDRRQEKVLESIRDTTRGDNNRRLPPVPSTRSSKFQQTAMKPNKVMPKKSSLSRTFISSKTNGVGNSRGVGPSSHDQGSRIRTFNPMSRNLATQEHGVDQLRDLRQQIALREKELKLKVAQQSKELISLPGREFNAMVHRLEARKSILGSADAGQLESKEPDRKRLKVSGSYSSQQYSDCRQQIIAAKSTLPSKEQALDNSSLQDRSMVDCNQGRSPPRRTQSSMVKWQKQADTPSDILTSGLKHGANMITDSRQADRVSMQKGVELNQPTRNGAHPSSGPFPRTLNQPPSEQHLVNGHEYHGGISTGKALEPSSSNICQESVDNGRLWNYLGSVNIDVQSLVDMEESLDKELEEAQEHRRRCEIEERNALKVYRKAQRALIEANARCTELYRKREMYSAHFRSLILNDSGLLWSSSQLEQVDIGLKPTKNTSQNLDVMPSPSHQMQPEYNGYNQSGYGSSIQCVTGASQIASYVHMNKQSLGNEPGCDPDASTSEPRHSKNVANGVSSPSGDPYTSADEDEETYPLDHETVPLKLKNDSIRIQKEKNHDSKRNLTSGVPEDSLILEATLRSELFARLPRRTLLKNSRSPNIESAGEPGIENDNGSERTQTSNGSVPFSEAEKNQERDLGGNDKPDRSISGAPVQIQNNEQRCGISQTASDSEDNGCSSRDCQYIISIFSPALILKSALSCIKMISPISALGLQGENQQDSACVHYIRDGVCLNTKDIQQHGMIANSVEESAGDICGKEIGTFSCNLAVDPFWPLCMYELRGKCNNDECPWQHFRDFSSDCEVGSTLQQQKCNNATEFLKCWKDSTQPTYLVDLDILTAGPCLYQSVVAQRNGKSWQKCFSRCLALSTQLQKGLPPYEPFLHGGDGRIEVHGNWNRQSSEFQIRNGVVDHLSQSLGSIWQSLETVLLILSLEGNTEALLILSRAIEANPTSEILWITYLLIYHGDIESVGKDDMFLHAVKNNDRSYGLWLMYINSRAHLDDRLVAYVDGLSALCHQGFATDRDEMHASACILDLFLQMMDFLCMSGNAKKAIETIYALFPEMINSDEPPSLLLPDILSCLTTADKYMFWVCCVYLVIYRKLPDVVVQCFECDKELLAIEWPPVYLPDEEKLRAVKLVEMVVDSAKLLLNSESVKSEISLRSAQHFSLSHFRCMVALDGLECCKNLLGAYMKLYPSCLELGLMSARVQMHDFEGFDNALSKWPKEVPGIHCIWNQYFEYAFQKGCPDYAKELIFRWLSSVSKVQYLPNGTVNAVDSHGYDRPLDLASALDPDFLTSNSDKLDIMFGYLNLSLAKLLQNDHSGARIAMDRALKAAAPRYIKHCLREHATFLLMCDSQFKNTALPDRQLKILKGYLDDIRSLPVSEPFSRQFINKIEKPRVRQLISNMLTPVSLDFSLVNLVLQVWNGPSLVPEELTQPKELVDFVEAILEIVPSNYQLAFSVCKLLKRDYNSIDITSGSVLYWASSMLVDTICHAIPIAPEYAWVEAAGILGDVTGIELISERFHKRALSIYPFSRKLWNSYYNLSKTRGDASTVVEAARGKGIEIG